MKNRLMLFVGMVISMLISCTSIQDMQKSGDCWVHFKDSASDAKKVVGGKVQSLGITNYSIDSDGTVSRHTVIGKRKLGKLSGTTLNTSVRGSGVVDFTVAEGKITAMKVGGTPLSNPNHFLSYTAKCSIQDAAAGTVGLIDTYTRPGDRDGPGILLK